MQVKCKQWSVEEERELRRLIDAGGNAHDISAKLGKSPNAVYEKAKRLGLRVIISSQNRKIITSKLELPLDLPNVEQQLKVLVAALKALETPGLDQAEVLRLRSIISGVKVYKELLADYLGFCELEERLFALEAKYAELTKGTAKSPQAS